MNRKWLQEYFLGIRIPSLKSHETRADMVRPAAVIPFRQGGLWGRVHHEDIYGRPSLYMGVTALDLALVAKYAPKGTWK